MGTYRKKKSRTKLSRKIIRLWYMHDFKCTKCSADVIPISLAQKANWTIHQREGVVIAPEGDVYRIATIEHIIPYAQNGGNHIGNLTLYCYHCNCEGAKEISKKLREQRQQEELQAILAESNP